jgi:hypothetical protein
MAWTRRAVSLLACVFPACISLHVEHAGQTHNHNAVATPRSSWSCPRPSLPPPNVHRLRGGLVGGTAQQLVEQEDKVESEGVVADKTEAFDDSEPQVCRL